MNKPKILLADEPTGSLDEHTSGAVFELLLDIVATEGVTLVMATHDRGWQGVATGCWRCTTGESMSQYPPDKSISPGCASQAVACAAWHSLFWLVFANAIGVLISLLLLFPSLNRLLGEWTYGAGSWST